MKNTLSKNKFLVMLLIVATAITSLFGVLLTTRPVSAEEAQSEVTEPAPADFYFPEADCFEEDFAVSSEEGAIMGGSFFRIYLTGGNTFASFGEKWVLALGEKGKNGESGWGVLADANGLVVPGPIEDLFIFEMRSDCILDLFVKKGSSSVMLFDTTLDSIYPGTYTKVVALSQKSSGGDFVFPSKYSEEEKPYELGSDVGGKYFRVYIDQSGRDSFNIAFRQDVDTNPICFKNGLFFVPEGETGAIHFIIPEGLSNVNTLVVDLYVESDFFMPAIFNASTDGFYSATNCTIYELTPLEAEPLPDEDVKDTGAIDGIKDWVNGVAGDISTVIKNNVGFTISSSAILVVGGGILAYLIFKRKR